MIYKRIRFTTDSNIIEFNPWVSEVSDSTSEILIFLNSSLGLGYKRRFLKNNCIYISGMRFKWSGFKSSPVWLYNICILKKIGDK